LYRTQRNINLEIIDPTGFYYSVAEYLGSGFLQLQQEKDLTYIVSFKPTLAGIYKVRSPNFDNPQGEYIVEVKPGPYKSIAMNPNSNYAEPRLATRLTGVKVNFDLVDEYSNKLVYDDFTAKSILVELINTHPDRASDIIVLEPAPSPNGITYR
jgi:hypothetical protein